MDITSSIARFISGLMISGKADVTIKEENMAGRVVDEGGRFLLEVLFGTRAKPTSYTLRLFTDSNPLYDADTNATHTTASGGGYADGTIEGTYADISLNSLGIPVVTWPSERFVFTEGALTNNASIIGYQVLSGTTLIFEEYLTTPFKPEIPYDALTITPTYTLGNGTPQ